MKRAPTCFLACFLAFFLAFALPAHGAAVGAARVHDVQSIAAVVNDDIISVFDVLARMKLVIATSQLDDSPETRQRLLPLVMRSLVDERLELQEAKRLNIKISDADVDRALKAMAARSGDGKTVKAFLAKAGVDRATLEDQIRAGLAWREIIRRRVRPTVDISDEEVNEDLARLKANKDKPQYLLAEIFLVIDSVEKEDEVRKTADRLVAQIVKGASFPALAKQFSESASAARGGDLGWVSDGQLEKELDERLRKMTPPSLSTPIRTPSGYYILALRDRRIPSKEAREGTIVSLSQVVLPLAPGASKDGLAALKAKAEEIRPRITSCSDMAKIGKEINSPLSGNLGKIRAADLPKNLREIATKLKVGRVSRAVETPQGVALFMVCDRKEPPPVVPDRDTVYKKLMADRIEMLARRYLRDLRRAASVDQRL